MCGAVVGGWPGERRVRVGDGIELRADRRGFGIGESAAHLAPVLELPIGPLADDEPAEASPAVARARGPSPDGEGVTVQRLAFQPGGASPGRFVAAVIALGDDALEPGPYGCFEGIILRGRDRGYL